MEQRKQYFIDPTFQTRFIIKFCLVNLAASALTFALLYALNRKTKTVAFDDLRIVVMTTADFLIPIMLQAVMVVAFFVAIATAIVALVTSHRISGPLYRLTLEFKRIRQKDLSNRIHVRAKDQLQRFADACEDTRLEYQRSIRTMQEAWSTLEKSVRRTAAETKDPEEKKRIEAGSAALSSELEKFKTTAAG